MSVCEASGSGRVELKRYPSPFPAVMWIVNVREMFVNVYLHCYLPLEMAMISEVTEFCVVFHSHNAILQNIFDPERYWSYCFIKKVQSFNHRRAITSFIY